MPIAELLRRGMEPDPFNEDNLQSLCRRCHMSKSGKEGAAAVLRRRQARKRKRVHPSEALLGGSR